MIKIICLGKIKEQFYTDAVKEYVKRLSKYTKLEIIEIDDEFNSNIDIILQREKEKILNVINKKDYIITLEIDGIQLSSIELSQKLDNIMLINSNLTFIIGGSYGLHNDIKELSNLHLSFSKLTFPHQLFRVILLEQIYRSYKILNNETYHK